MNFIFVHLSNLIALCKCAIMLDKCIGMSIKGELVVSAPDRVMYNAKILQGVNQTSCPSRELLDSTRAEITEDLRAILRNIIFEYVITMHVSWVQTSLSDSTRSNTSYISV